MTVKWAFIAGFIMAKSILLAWFIVWYFHGPSEATSTLFALFVSINAMLVAALTRAITTSPMGNTPVSVALNGGATQHFIDHPENLPEAIQQAVRDKT